MDGTVATILVVLGIAIGFSLLFYFLKIKPKKEQEEIKEEIKEQGGSTEIPASLQDKMPFAWTDFKTTPLGVSINSVIEIPEKVLTALDEAVSFRIAVIKRIFPTWTKGLTHAEYIFIFLHPDGRSPEWKLPYLTVGGYMTAGTIATGTKPAVILPHHIVTSGDDWDLNYLKESADNEMEHLTEYMNDKVLFLRFTGGFDEHKHFPIPEDMLVKPVGFASFEKEVFDVPCHYPSEERVAINLPLTR